MSFLTSKTEMVVQGNSKAVSLDPKRAIVSAIYFCSFAEWIILEIEKKKKKQVLNLFLSSLVLKIALSFASFPYPQKSKPQTLHRLEL